MVAGEVVVGARVGLTVVVVGDNVTGEVVVGAVVVGAKVVGEKVAGEVVEVVGVAVG